MGEPLYWLGAALLLPSLPRFEGRIPWHGRTPISASQTLNSAETRRTLGRNRRLPCFISEILRRPDCDRYNYPEAYLRAKIIGMLRGQAAEEIVCGTRTTGAESDIEHVTSLARRMVTCWGMSNRLGWFSSPRGRILPHRLTEVR